MSEKFSIDFWRWYFSQYEEIPKISKRQTVIHNVRNIFNGQKKDLTIDLKQRIVTSGDQGHTLLEYLSKREKKDQDQLAMNLLVELERFKMEQEQKSQKAPFFYNDKEMLWFKKKGDSADIVANFNIIFESIIRIYNMDERKWERNYQCYIEFKRDGEVERSSTFTLEPDDCVNANQFQKAIWNIEFRQVFFSNDSELLWFFTFLNDYYRPRVVSQYDHFGFIRYNRKKYYLAKNVLIEIPEPDSGMRLIAPDDQDCFHITGDQYIKLDPRVDPAPHFQLGPIDEDTLLYQKDMAQLFSKGEFQHSWHQVSSKVGQMVAGQINEPVQGTLILAYIFSFLFFEDIYKTYSHIIYFYIFGKHNTGKGKLAEIILSFFGIPLTDSMTDPTTTSLENNMASHSQIPAWIDEFVPELAGKKSRIRDQLFNTWFELRTRQVSSYGNRKRNEVKITRSMLFFTSNYLPESGHLNSRLLKFEYSLAKRGDEEHYYWLSSRKSLLQKLFISSLQWYHEFDRFFYTNELIRYKRLLKEETKKQLNEKKEKTGIAYNLEDRQIEQCASLCATYEFIATINTNVLGKLKENIQELSDCEDDQLSESFKKMIKEDSNNQMYRYSIQFLMDNAQETGMNDPLAEFLNTIAYLVDDGSVTEKHYTWTMEGDLKVWFGGIWAAYEKFKGNTATNKAAIRRMFAGISDNPHGATQNWQPQHSNRPVRKHGYRIKEAYRDKRFAFAFNWNEEMPLPYESKPGENARFAHPKNEHKNENNS